MRAIQTIAFFLSLFVPSISQASDIEEALDTSRHRYCALHIIQEIQASDKESYLKDDLLVGDFLCVEIKGGNLVVIAKFKAEIDAMNTVLQKEKTKLVQNWIVQYYPEEGKVCGRRSAPIKCKRF